jgi:hypothetical protein
MGETRDDHIDDDDSIARYLLGLSSDEERSAIQERLFQDEDYFDRIRAAEYELLDAYSGGELSASERELVENSLLLSESGRRKLDFAREFAAVQKRRRKRYAPYFLIAAAVVVATVVGLLISIRKGHTTVESRATQVQSSKPPVMFSVLLTPGATRGAGQIKRVTIPPGTGVLRLQLDLEGDRHSAYIATLKTTAGTQVWEQAGLIPQPDGSVLCLVPASNFESGSYELTLAATSGRSPEVVAYYYFQISR